MRENSKKSLNPMNEFSLHYTYEGKQNVGTSNNWIKSFFPVFTCIQQTEKQRTLEKSLMRIKNEKNKI